MAILFSYCKKTVAAVIWSFWSFVKIENGRWQNRHYNINIKNIYIIVSNDRVSEIDFDQNDHDRNDHEWLKVIRKMDPAWGKIAQGNFSLSSYRNGRTGFDSSLNKCRYIFLCLNRYCPKKAGELFGG